MDPHARLRSQIRAGRELLNMNQGDIAASLGMSLSKISRSESGETKSGDTLLEIKHGLERMGVRFTQSGVELVENFISILEGENIFPRLMDDIYESLKDQPDAEVLIECADERESSADVIERVRKIRNAGIKIRALVEEGNTHLMAPLDEYRVIPKDRFINDVAFIYGGKFAICTNDNTQIVIFRDPVLALSRSNIFNLLWGFLQAPVVSTAHERY